MINRKLAIALFIVAFISSILLAVVLLNYRWSTFESTSTLVNDKISDIILLIDTNPELAKQKLFEVNRTVAFINSMCLDEK